MDRSELEIVVRNMIEHDYRESSDVSVESLQSRDGEFADEEALVKIKHDDDDFYDVSLRNHKWHSSKGYDIEHNDSGGSGSDRFLEVVLISDDGVRTYTKILFV